MHLQDHQQRLAALYGQSFKAVNGHTEFLCLHTSHVHDHILVTYSTAVVPPPQKKLHFLPSANQAKPSIGMMEPTSCVGHNNCQGTKTPHLK